MASISGAVSGMDTASIISQLMQLEALPQRRLESRISEQERQVNALQTLNSKLASIAGKAAKLAESSAWSAMTATSSSEHVTVTADKDALPTSLTVSVTAVAAAERKVYTDAGTADQPMVTAGKTFSVTYDDGRAAETFDVGDGTMTDIAEAINTQTEGLRASLVKSGTTTDAEGNEVPVYKLHISSTETGQLSSFTVADTAATSDPGYVSAFLGGGTVTRAGADAAITVNGQTLSSATNMFTDLMPGVDLTVDASAPVTATETVESTLTVSRDTESLVDSVKALVDATNATLTDIDSLTDYNAESGSAGLLAGNSTVRAVRNELLASVTAGIDGTSLASVGIEVTRDGQVTFDAAVFEEAYEKDPLATAQKFTGRLAVDLDAGSTGSVELYEADWRTRPGSYRIDATEAGGTIAGAQGELIGNLLEAADGTDADGLTVEVFGQVSGTINYTQGFAARLEALAQRASDSTIGTVTAAIQGRNDRIDRLETDVADWDVRLELRRQTLERQFTAMEVALGQLQNQGSWLASQIAGLPSYSSGS